MAGFGYLNLVFHFFSSSFIFGLIRNEFEIKYQFWRVYNVSIETLGQQTILTYLMDVKRTAQQWLDAYSDPRSYLYTFSRCMALADLHADGDYKLVLADLGSGTSNVKLKVFKGVSVMSENTLLEIPTALVIFYHDQQGQKIPAIAVACGSSIYIYKNMKPYYKFSLPELEINPLEMDLWAQAKNDEIKPNILYTMLENIKNEIGFSNLSYQSQRILMLSQQNEEELQNELKFHSSQPLKKQTVITCMTTLHKSSNSVNSVSSLVVGTENGWIYIIDSEAFTVLDSVNQSSTPYTADETVPVVIKTIGLYDVDYRIVIYNRNGKITLLRRGWSEVKVILQLSVRAVDMCLLPDSGNIFLGLMDSSLECYTKKGKKLWNIKLSSHVTGLLPIPIVHQGLTLIAVALEGGTICFYNGRDNVDSIMAADTIAGMVFGRFGLEEHCLVLITISGTLQVKVLKRTAQFSQISSTGSFSSINPNPKFKISKKTKIFLEQAAFEMNNSIQMHQKFQSELFRFRLETTREFYESLNKINNPISNDNKLPLNLSAEVFGLGPTFKITLTLENMSQTSENINIWVNKTLGIVFFYNDKIYNLENPYLPVPFLVPGLVYKFQTIARTVTDNMVSEDIQVFVTSPTDAKPILSTVIHMPICDVLPIEI